MNVVRNDWWVTPVWEIQTDFDKSFNDNLILELKSYYTDKSMENTKEPNIWVMQTPCLKLLNDYIVKVVTELTYDYVSLNYNKFEYQHTRGWANFNLPGQSMPIHGHGGSKITATYYIQAEENSGDLLLIDPRGGVDWDKEVYNNVNGAKFKRVTPKPGKLVFFPSYVLHSVDVNKSKDIRISLSTDMQTFSLDLIKQFMEKNKEQKNVV
ncbi:hypothetical protein EBU71_00890 [bacterium]|nr:hypothetical protein [Candidatus Elulimicrobium humile]